MVERIESQSAIAAAQKLENIKAKIDSNGNGLKGNEILNFKKFAQAEGIKEEDINTYLKNIGLAVDKSDKDLHKEDIQEFKNEQPHRTSRKTKNTIIDMRQKCMDKALEAFKAAKTPEEKAKIMDLVQTLPRVAEDTEAFEKQLDAWSKNFDAALAAVTTEKDEAAKSEGAEKEQKAEDKAEVKEEKPAAERKPEEKVETKPEEKQEPAKMQKIKVPAGWSISQIAKAFGISRADVLKANVDADGNKAYRVSKKGIEYFLADQEINIPADAKLKDGVKLEPKTSAKKTQQFNVTHKSSAEMKGSTANGGQFNIARESDGSVQVTIPIPYKYASTVTISAKEAKGKTDQQLAELALQKAEAEAKGPTHKSSAEMKGSLANGGKHNISREADGSVKITIPFPYQYASTVTIPASEAAGKSEEQLVKLAHQKAEAAAKK